MMILSIRSLLTVRVSSWVHLRATCYKDELEAKQIQLKNNDSLKLKRVANLNVLKSRKALREERKERLGQLLSSGQVWWNPSKPQ